MTRHEAIDRLRAHADAIKAIGATSLYLYGSTARDEAGVVADGFRRFRVRQRSRAFETRRKNGSYHNDLETPPIRNRSPVTSDLRACDLGDGLRNGGRNATARLWTDGGAGQGATAPAPISCYGRRRRSSGCSATRGRAGCARWARPSGRSRCGVACRGARQCEAAPRLGAREQGPACQARGQKPRLS